MIKFTYIILTTCLLVSGSAFANDTSNELIKNISPESKKTVTKICDECGEPMNKCKCNNRSHQKKQIVNIKVTKKGYEPSQIDVEPGTHVILHVTRKTNTNCAKEIVVPSLHIEEKLPLNKMVSINLGKLAKGEIKFGCGMDMMTSGQITVR